MDRIYLDHQATTPVDPRVVGMMLPYFTEVFGNAASRDHAFGFEAKKAVDEARHHVAALIGAHDDEIIFTSGATESDNLALLGTLERDGIGKDHLITAATEHKAVLDAARELARRGRRVTVLGVDSLGRIDPDDVRRAISPETALVSIMAANNEIGTLAPLEEIGRICAEQEVLFHSDVVQQAGHLPLNVRAAGLHMASLSAHKMYGPKGVGALYRKRSNPRVELRPLQFGGGHERGLRSGTLNVPAIVGFGEAARLARQEMPKNIAHAKALVQTLYEELKRLLPAIGLNGHPTERLPHNLSVWIPGIESRALVVELKNVALATGSACTSESVEPSHVIKALGADDARAHSSLRLSVGRSNTEKEMMTAASDIADACEALSGFSF